MHVAVALYNILYICIWWLIPCYIAVLLYCCMYCYYFFLFYFLHFILFSVFLMFYGLMLEIKMDWIGLTQNQIKYCLLCCDSILQRTDTLDAASADFSVWTSWRFQRLFITFCLSPSLLTSTMSVACLVAAGTPGSMRLTTSLMSAIVHRNFFTERT